MSSVHKLEQIIRVVPNRLLCLSDASSSIQPAPGKWSPKQELGHLIDSAANNHQRIVRSQLEDRPRLRGYNGDVWVLFHAYQQREWRELVGLWRSLNRQLVRAAESISDDGWARTCTIDDSQPLTIRFIVDDYVVHLLHHLAHIGVQVSEFAGGS